MGLFNRKKAPIQENPHQIQLDFFEDWFQKKYAKLFASEYLEGLKYVKDLDIDRRPIHEFTDPNYRPTDIEEVIDKTNLKIGTIASIETAYITLGHLVIKTPGYMLDEDFDKFYHTTLPKLIEALRLLDQYGTEHDYPYMRVNAVLRSVRYTPNFTIEAGDVAAHDKIEMLDLSFYDRFDKLRLEIYKAMYDLVKKFQDNEHKLDFEKSIDIIDDLLDVNKEN